MATGDAEEVKTSPDSFSQAERSPGTNAGTFATVFARALGQLGADGRLPTAAARDLRRAIADTDRDTRAAIAFEPEKNLGAFDTLPTAAREGMVAAIVERDRWDTRGYELGAWHPFLLRLLWRLKARADRLAPEGSGATRTMRELMDVFAYGVRKGPAFLLGKLHRQWLAARGRLSSRPALSELLSLADVHTRDLAVCYARGIPQPERYRGHWHDASRHAAVGRVLGMDFLSTGDACWYVESNVSPQLDGARVRLRQRDPFVHNLVEFAAVEGYRRLTVLDNTSSGADPVMVRQFAAAAAERGIAVTLLELPNVPGRKRKRSYGIPSPVDDGTLVVRYRVYPSALDYLFNMKRASFRALETYQREVGDPDLHLPVTGTEPLLGDVAADEPFPNVAYKLPEVEQGRGVFFLKARSAEHAKNILKDAMAVPRKRELQERVLNSFTNQRGVYQSYVKSRMLEGRRLYKIRALVLISPVGVRFLAAHRVVSANPVPERLAYGIVTDLGPYLVNAARGARVAELPPDEELAVARAATAVGRGLAWAAEYGFLCR